MCELEIEVRPLTSVASAARRAMPLWLWLWGRNTALVLALAAAGRPPLAASARHSPLWHGARAIAQPTRCVRAHIAHKNPMKILKKLMLMSNV